MKRRRRTLTSRVFEQLPADISSIILNKLSYIDLVQFRSVCSSWRKSVGEEFVSWIPWLMLPSKEDVEDGDDFVTNNIYNGFLNLCENRVYSLKTTPEEFMQNCCIGSSHGWLVFLERKAVPFLYNPFKQVKIEAPSVAPLLGLKTGFSSGSCSQRLVRDCLIKKAILTGKPDSNNKGFGLFLLCRSGMNIAYHESGENCWTFPDISHPPYQDIIFHDNNLYALSDYTIIEVWHLEDGAGGCFTKKSDTFLHFPDKSHVKGHSLRAPFFNKLYLVESCGDILLVVRYIGHFVDQNGKLLWEWELPSFGNQPIVCPYRTVLFHVYKMDLEELKWVEIESLGDRALFLGGNHSVSVSSKSFPGCEKNSIYFTDDNWCKMEEDYSYGGHDMGIYNLKDGSVKPIYEFSSERIQPPPCWVIPPSALPEP